MLENSLRLKQKFLNRLQSILSVVMPGPMLQTKKWCFFFRAIFARWRVTQINSKSRKCYLYLTWRFCQMGQIQ